MKSTLILLCLTVSVFGQGSGFGMQQVINSNPGQANRVRTADIDGDGRPDVVFASASQNRVAWQRNQGGGTFGPEQVITTSAAGVSGLVAADMDGDGDTDIVSASRLSGKVEWYENLGSGVFGVTRLITYLTDGFFTQGTVSYKPTDLQAADVNGDGRLDVVVSIEGVPTGPPPVNCWNPLIPGSILNCIPTPAVPGNVLWYRNQGGGTFSALATGSLAPWNNTTSRDCVHTADLDGDGDQDILTASRQSPNVSWYRNLGNGAFTGEQLLPGSLRSESVHTADVDGDGDLDVLSANLSNNSLSWFENLGSGNIGSRQTISSTTISPRCISSADLDGDGDQDILAAASASGKIAWYENLGGGSIGAEQVITASALGALAVTAADLDGDGDQDVISGYQGFTRIAWYENLIQRNFAMSVAQALNGDLTLSVIEGIPFANYYLFHSTDTLNATSPGSGPLFGLHISLAAFQVQAAYATSGSDPLFGGTLDANGAFSLTLPATSVAPLAGISVWSVAIQEDPNLPAQYEPAPLTGIAIN